MELFRALGDQVELAWRRQNYRESAFTAIACDALEREGMHERVAWRELLAWCIRTPLLDTDNHVFGDVPLRVYEGPRFFIEALVWNDGQIAIHDHAFAGAFTVLAGTSLHCCYSFRADDMVNEGFGVGGLELVRAERLEKGEVRPIEAGRSFIHAVYHMDTPTVSLVLRSKVDTRALPQLAYLPPGIAFDRAAVQRDAIDKPLAALRVAANVDRALFLSLAREAIVEREAHLAFEVVSRAARGPLQAFPDVLSELIAHCIQHHPVLEPVLERTIASQLRALDLLMRRSRASAPEARLLLALLLNIPRRQELLALAGAQSGDDPVDTVLHWLRVASASRVLPQELGTRELAAVRAHLTDAPTSASALDVHTRRVLEPLVA